MSAAEACTPYPAISKVKTDKVLMCFLSDAFISIHSLMAVNRRLRVTTQLAYSSAFHRKPSV